MQYPHALAHRPDAPRSPFRADCDRIQRSAAFRALAGKTQVVPLPRLDRLRTRITHVLEVSAISRSIARALDLDESLAEAIALAHDLGHPPFGHAGERALARLLRDDGGFDHNRQTIRVVDWLEDRYPHFRGLNLCYETREGILKHGASFEHPVPLPDRSGRCRSASPAVAVRRGSIQTIRSFAFFSRAATMRW